MEDILCKCSKKCFCYTTLEKQEDKLLKFIIYKCNYLYNSDKKNSCDFYKKVNIKNNLDDVEMNDNIASETNEKSHKIENNENNEKNDNTIKTARTAKTARTKVIIYKEDVESKIEKFSKLIINEMQNALKPHTKLSIPLIVDSNSGKNWNEAH